MATCTRTAAQSQTQTQQGTEETLLPIAQLSACPQHVHGFASHAHQQSSAGSDPSMNHAASSSHAEQTRPQRHATIAPTSYHPSGASATHPAFNPSSGSDSCPTQPNLSSLPVRRNQHRTPPGLQTAIDTPVPADASSSHASMPHDPMFMHDPWSSAHAQLPTANHSDSTANAWQNYRGINSAAIHSSAVQQHLSEDVRQALINAGQLSPHEYPGIQPMSWSNQDAQLPYMHDAFQPSSIPSAVAHGIPSMTGPNTTSSYGDMSYMLHAYDHHNMFSGVFSGQPSHNRNYGTIQESTTHEPE